MELHYFLYQSLEDYRVGKTIEGKLFDIMSKMLMIIS